MPALSDPEVIQPGQSGARRSDADIRFAEWLAHVLDDLYVDPIIGFFLPGLGDVIGSLLGLSIVVIAARRGVSRVVLARMLLNLGVDGLVGAVPVVGDVLDVFNRANLRNVALLRARDTATSARASDWLWVGGALVVFLSALVAPLALLGWVIVKLMP